MTTTYGTKAGIESLVSPATLVSWLDDDHSGTLSTTEEGHIANAIERAATKINMAVGRQYNIADVTANTWLAWANNVLAAEMLAARRGNPAPQSIMDAAKECEEMLEQIRWGRASLPEQIPSFNFAGAVSNFHVEPGRRIAPVRVSKEESTGGEPVPGIVRHYSDQSGIY